MHKRKAQSEALRGPADAHAAQCLGANVLVWAKRWLTLKTPELKSIGFVRLMRDVFTTTGRILFDALGRLTEIRLNEADTLIKPWVHGLAQLLKAQLAAVNLGKT